MDEKIFDEWFNELINEHKHNKMKQFSLKEYLKNPNQRVVTIGGEEVRIICTDRKTKHFPIVALCTSAITGQETCRSYGINGNYNAHDKSVVDLMFAPQKHEYWINVYKSKEEDTYFVITTSLYLSKQEAKDCAISSNNSYDYIDTVKIEWED